MIKVGVVLPRPPDDPGEWLGAAAAFEAAGADALWLDHGRAPRLDPLVLVAALAALTYRARLVAAVTEAHPAALTTLAQLSRNRLTLITPNPANPGDPEGPRGAGGLEGAGGAEGVGEGVRVVWRMADGSYREEAGRWSPSPVPLGRTAWRETLRQAAERGEYGVLVPADPRLLDLLRNPDDPEGRQDLQLAQG